MVGPWSWNSEHGNDTCLIWILGPTIYQLLQYEKKKSNVFVESHRISHVSILVVELKQENESKKYHKHHVRKLKQENDMLHVKEWWHLYAKKT
jgi:hypothetical protein